MLTKEQIEAARESLAAKPYMGVSAREAFSTALAAYSRMVALAENLRTMATLSVEEHRRNVRLAEHIDRALEG